MFFDNPRRTPTDAAVAIQSVQSTKARLDSELQKMRLMLLRRQTELEERRLVVHKKMIDLMQRFYQSGAARASPETRAALDALEEELRPLRQHVDAIASTVERAQRDRRDERESAPERHMPFEAVADAHGESRMESLFHRYPLLRGADDGDVDELPDVRRSGTAARREARRLHAQLKARLMAVVRKKAHDLLLRHGEGQRLGGGAARPPAGRIGPAVGFRIQTHVGSRTKGDLLRLMRRQGGDRPGPIRGGGRRLLRRLVDGLLDDRQRTRLELYGGLLPRELGEDQLRMFTELHTGATQRPLPPDATPMEQLGARLPASPVGLLFGW